jgi:hypothetical protein
MKIKLLILGILLSAGHVFAQSKTVKNDLLPEKLIMFDDVLIADSAPPRFNDEGAFKYIQLTKRKDAGQEKVEDYIINLAKSKRYKVSQEGFSAKFKRYPEFGVDNGVTIPYFASKGARQIDEKYFNYKLTNNKLLDFKSILFGEEWILDKEKFTFQKRVLNAAPVVHTYRESDSLKKVKLYHFLFGINLDTTFLYTKGYNDYQLITNINYEFYLHELSAPNGRMAFHFEKFYCYNWTLETRMNFLETIFYRVLDEKSPALDPITHKPLSRAELYDRLDVKPKVIMVEDVMSHQLIETKVRGTLRLEEYVSVEFTEEWYYNPKTLHFKKKVIGAAPVRYYYDAADMELKKPIREIPFYVQFN